MDLYVPAFITFLYLKQTTEMYFLDHVTLFYKTSEEEDVFSYELKKFTR